MYLDYAKGVMDFIKKSPSQYHAVDNIRKILLENNFIELFEGDNWNLEKGKSYFATRNNSSIIAFKVGNDDSDYSFNIVASHTDSPNFKLKVNSDLKVKDKYLKLNTEGYGGMTLYTWLDRPLSLAGRIFVSKDSNITQKLFNIDKDLLMIPSIAIHMRRDINDGYKFNKQVDMLPLLSTDTEASILDIVAEEAGVDKDEIISFDLSLYNRANHSIWGKDSEFFSCPQIDNLECAYTTLVGFLKGNSNKSINVYASFDNEEVGSLTKQGAKSTFLQDVLKRINSSLNRSDEEYYRAVANSFLVSADNAHAAHPNHMGETDENNNTFMNEGIVIKSHAGAKYTSDGTSMAIFKEIARRANVPLQYFSNRSDKEGGSTLGNLSNIQVSLNAVDIGLPQLAMHSSYESAGVKDTKYMIDAMEEFFSSHIKFTDKDSIEITK